MKPRIAAAAALAFFAFGQLAAAEPGKASAQAAPAVRKEQPAPAITAKRDPFRPELDVVLPPPPPECGRLCEYDLVQLRVAALVTGMSVPLAGVEAPNGKVYIVDRGTPIGKLGGRVVEVANGQVVVEEPCKQAGKVARCRTNLKVAVAQPVPQQEENLLRR